MSKQIKVLLADDSAEFGQACCSVLRSHGFDVFLSAKNGNEVLASNKSTQPDVVLMDTFSLI